MDDLNGLDWLAGSNTTSKPAPPGTGNYYSSIPALRPTPSPHISGRNTPLSTQASGAPKPFAPSKSAATDSFSNLVSFGPSKNGTLTLQEQQQKLQEEKRKQEAEKKRQYDTQFGNGQFWDGLGSRDGCPAIHTPSIGSRSGTPGIRPPPTSLRISDSPAISQSAKGKVEEDDLFAAFNKDTVVDNSSHYPPPSASSSRTHTPAFGTTKAPDLTQPNAWEQPSTGLGGDFGDDDDPFGLGQMKQKTTPAPPIPTIDDDDFLGDLGKPVEEVRRATPVMKEVAAEEVSEPESDDPWDKAVAELVDMGFSAEQSRRALTESGSGLDIQAAVGWILNDAHRQAKQKQSRGTSQSNGPSRGGQRESSRDVPRREDSPAWMREEGRDRSQPRRDENRSPAGEADLSKAAAAVGSNLFKTANSLWKTSQKKVQRAVADFQQEGDPSQPKWMREAAEREAAERKAAAEGRGRKAQPTAPEVTDEALMLEGGGRPPPRKAKAPEQRFPPSSSNASRDQSPAIQSRPADRASPIPRWQQSTPSDPRSRISKQAVEEQSAQAYVSPARRKKATPRPQPPPQPEVDLFSPAPIQSKPATASLRTAQRSSPVPSKPSTPIPTRPKAPTRNIPALSPSALQTSSRHRLEGTQHFKRGDYASAHESYSSSLSSLPERHPITIILLCNRSLTSLKTGVPKSAVSDADQALEIIGVSRGDGESIDLGPGEGGGNKEMKDFYGKALSRKAEALEQMEKWADAGAVWKLAVESGAGGPTAIQGRTRCEKALAPKPAPRAATPQARPKPAPKPVRSAMADLGGTGGDDSAAVKRLREANSAAERADDEKFALSDKVDEKVGRWRDGKRDNLRALLGSLDLVMWEGANWKKIGMHELVQNNKVKINYMKAIGKCHPDKLPQDSTTETKMIAGLIFATLNESWDKFKQQNGM